MDKKDTTFHLIPREEQKCIWMVTGLISYKLCDRNYHCEDCPFDQAMRNEAFTKDDYRESEIDFEEELLENVSSLQIDGSVFYHLNHCWIKVENPEKVKVGVDHFLAQFIVNPMVIILPQIGDFITQGKYFAHIIQKKNILPVIFPINGYIEASNLHLRKKPKLITSDPLGKGWLVKVKPDNLVNDLKYLLFGKKAILWYQKEERELTALRDSMLKQTQRNLGLTMQDGGNKISCLGDMLTPEQYSQILDSFITKPKNLGNRYKKPNRETSSLSKKDKESK